MKKVHFLRTKALLVPLLLITTLTLARVALSQQAQQTAPASQNRPASRGPGTPVDWSHHHLIFSSPGTQQEALGSGDDERWLTITNDPRYGLQQQRRRGTSPILPVAGPLAAEEENQPCGSPRFAERDDVPALTLETEQGVTGDLRRRGVLPAVIPPPAELVARFEERPEGDGCKNRFEKDWSETEGNNGTTGLGNYPATFTSTAASCSNDYAVYNTGLAGSSSQASIVAFNELYSGCSGRPSIDWAFNTGGIITASVALSLDGTQVAFVQNSGGVASLVVLKWAAVGSLTSPRVLTSNSSYPNCSAPCMISLTLSGSPSDTYSSPFISYGTGGSASTLYVGDDAGNLHEFINIFSSGVPSEVTTSPWPVTLNTSSEAALSSPVYDSVSGNIFVGDYLANISSSCEPGVSSASGQCGYLYSVNAGSGTVVRSAQLDYNLGISDGPLVDSTAGKVYAFVGADHSTSCSGNPCAAVFQFPANFSPGAPGTEATVGAGYEFLMSGNFDNQYFTSANPANPTGHLYVIGGTGPENNTLYAVTITNNLMGSATAGPVLANNYTNNFYSAGLPVTEFCNNGSDVCTASQGTDYLFLGVLAFGSNFSTNPCPNQSATVGCIMGFTIPTSGVIASSATPNGTLPEAGGVSGIVVDNGALGASNIYFSTLLNETCTTSGGSGGCAVSATQAALH